jgi:hypothetical protein
VAPRDDEGWEPTDDLYALYRHWAEKEGLRFIETKQEMVGWLRRQGYEPVKRRRSGSYPRAGWRGLTIVTQTVDDLPA